MVGEEALKTSAIPNFRVESVFGFRMTGSMANQEWACGLCDAEHSVHVEVVSLLLGHGAAVPVQGEGGSRALLLAVSCRADLVSLLLERGVDPSTHDERGQTALMEACWTGNVSSVVQLLGRGADPRHVTGAATRR